MSDTDFEMALFLSRNEIEHRCATDRTPPFYIPSFSSRVIVYKGMLTGTQLKSFYLDLQDPAYETSLAVFHQRYSTNTFPTWPLAHPFRMVAHNGEINTLRGNRHWVHAREADLSNPALNPSDLPLLHPIIQPGGSDSSSLDNAFELLSISGRGPLHAMLMLVPSAYRSEESLSQKFGPFTSITSASTNLGMDLRLSPLAMAESWPLASTEMDFAPPGTKSRRMASFSWAQR